MKRKILSVVILVILSTGLKAQDKPILLGLRVGGNLGWMSPEVEGYTGTGSVPGFTWGLTGQFLLTENYSILTGFNMIFTGGKMDYAYWQDVDNDNDLDSGMMSRNYSLRYIQLPLCLKMTVDIAPGNRIIAKIGLGTAFLLRARADDRFSYEGGEVTEKDKDITGELTLLRESLIVGAGWEFILKGSTLMVLDLTYDTGFNNLMSDFNPATTKVKPKAFQNFIEIGVGVVF